MARHIAQSPQPAAVPVRRQVARVVPKRTPPASSAPVAPRKRRGVQLPHGAKVVLFKQHKAALLAHSSALPAPPASFDPDRQYRVKLKRSVEMPDHGVWLRPVHDVVVSGAFAATIADKIIGAKAI